MNLLEDITKDPRGRNLEERIADAERIGGGCRETAECWVTNAEKNFTQFFHVLQLPIPDKGEYYKTTDGGYMVLLDPCAITFRFNPFGTYPPAHPHILQPLADRSVGSYRLTINPGVVCPAPRQSVKWLFNRLAKDNLLFYDAKKRNAGLMPGYKSDDFPDGYPLLIDPGAVTDNCPMTLGDITRSLVIPFYFDRDVPDWLIDSPIKIRSFSPSPQEEFYRPLRKAFENAWPQSAVRHRWPKPYYWDETEISKEGLKNFLHLCKEFKNAGKMVCSWQHYNYNGNGTHAENTGTAMAAQNYARKLQQWAPDLFV